MQSPYLTRGRNISCGVNPTMKKAPQQVVKWFSERYKGKARSVL